MCRILNRLLVSLARLAVRSGRSKDLEIIVLRHQLTVLHDITTDQPSPTRAPTDPTARSPAPPEPTQPPNANGTNNSFESSERHAATDSSTNTEEAA